MVAPFAAFKMIYLDNSATTKQHPEVTEIMVKLMTEDFGNPSSLYRLGVDAEKLVKTARSNLAAGLSYGGNKDFAKTGSVVFTSGGTEADNMAIFGAAKALRRKGNKIITTAVEHPAVLECCEQLQGQGFEVVHIGVDRKCRLDIEALENAIDDRTILISMMHVNNEIGTVMPVGRVKEIMRAKNCPGLFHCDGVQSFGKLPMPKDADLIAVSGHKIHGPKGSGALWISDRDSSGNRINLPAYIVGGGQEGGKRSGTENTPAIAGLGKAAELITKSDEDRDDKCSLVELRELLHRGLTDSLMDVVINSPIEAASKAEDEGICCPSVLSVTFMGTRGEVLLHTLEEDGIFVSTGSACSSNKKGQSHVLKAMGLKDKEIEGTLRFSLGRFNSREEIEITVDRVTAAVNRFRRLGSFR